MTKETLSRTLQSHKDAILSGEVSKTNVIGLRKALNASERERQGWGNGRTSPKDHWQDVQEVVSLLPKHRPLVVGELHDSGIEVLRNPRYRKRWTEYQQRVIAGPNVRFRLVRFDRLGDYGQYAAPVYQVCRYYNNAGWPRGSYDSFCFRNVPWQAGGNGPEVVAL